MEMHFYGEYQHDDSVKAGDFGTQYVEPITQAEGRTRIVVPTAVGLDILTLLRAGFIDRAGGCTEMDATGWWHAYKEGRYTSEPVKIFDIAGLPMEAVKGAAEIILAAGQTDVYVELASGQVVWFNATPSQEVGTAA